MDEVWLEVLSSSKENLTEENSSKDENLAEENSSEDGNLAEVNSSEDDNLAEENSSEDEDLAEENSSEDENLAEENSSEDENLAEENSSEDENLAEENSSAEENLAEENSSAEENWARENNSSTEENWVEKDRFMNLFFIEEHGLVFEVATVNKEVCVVEIVVVGNGDCGKTQLINSVFGDHPSFTVKNRDGRDEYRIYLSKNMFVHIWISDVKDEEFVRKENFRYKTVVFFCYAVDDLETLVSVEETWIPTIFRKHTKRMSCFLVGIQRDPKTKPKATNGINSEEQKMAIEEKARELFQKLGSGRRIGCSIEVKSSMLKVFQSAIDTVYPWTSLG